MELSELFKELADYGILGFLIAWLMWKDFKFTARIFKVIENNTQAMTELKEGLNQCKYQKNNG